MKQFFLVVGAGMMTTAGVAQAPPAAAPAPPPAAAAAASVPPRAVVAKIALISFEEAVLATNEGQRALQEIQKKFQPKKAEIDSLSKEVDTLKQQYQSAVATLSDADKAARLKAIDTKEKALNRATGDAQSSYTTEAQDAINKIAQKMGPTVVKYVQQNGYTLLLDSTGQQGAQPGGLTVMWAVPGTDISQAVVDAYNVSSGVAAPVPSAPAPAPAARQPGATAPKQ